MEANKIMNADILDILFEGRNKEYGAYELRKSYNKRMTRSIIIMLGVCLLIFIGSIIAKTISERTPKPVFVDDVNLQDMKEPEQKKEPPPPPPPKEPPKVEVTKFTPPQIVKDELVKPEEKPPEQEKLEDTKIGSFNQEGIQSDVVEAPKEVGTGQVEAPKVQEEDYDKVFTAVEVPAKYKGQDWVTFVSRNIDANTPADNGAPTGNYVVDVTFTVDKSGNISDVVINKDPGYGCSDVVKRAISRSSGQWEPALQNGKKVIYRENQKVTFQVTE